MENRAKHTKGPWEATPGEIIGKRVANGSMDLICDLRGSPFVDDIAYNSLLIAASPELLEACKAIVARINGEWDNPSLLKFGPCSENLIEDVLCLAKYPIAKAEGMKTCDCAECCDIPF
jgi:hypothetical protein